VGPVHPLLSIYPVTSAFHVLWGDEDSFGHVNNLAFLRWCESVRVDYLREVGFWVGLMPGRLGPILASLHCDYKAQLHYPGDVIAGARVSHIGRSSITMDHALVSPAANAIAAVVTSTLVLVDYEIGRPVPIPKDIRERINALEQSTGGAPKPKSSCRARE
jgi:acyl-CoA thioester hydrolase